MFSIDINNVKKLVENSYIHHVVQELGDKGNDALRSLLDKVKLIYQQCPPEQLPGTLTVVRSLEASPLNPTIATLGSLNVAADLTALGQALITGISGGHSVVEISSDESMRHLTLTSDVDLKALAKSAIVYRFDITAERILAGNYEDFVLSVSPLLLSNFAVPTFRNLEDALKYYGRFVVETKCNILKDVWEEGVDGPRLVFVNKPEATMRNSLTQALDLILRDATVKPEQNTDETKPVDIRVNWSNSTAVALIEIKWLGKSTAKPKPGATEPSYTSYSASRAQDGAEQLADYIDREVRHSDSVAPRGYLVVFDGRRKGTQGKADPLKEVDALAFENQAIALAPDIAKQRSDFAEPVRFFMRPRKSHFLAA